MASKAHAALAAVTEPIFPLLSVFPTCFSMMLVYKKKNIGIPPRSAVFRSGVLGNVRTRDEVEDEKHRKFLYLRGGHVEGEDYSAFGEAGIRENLSSSMHTRFYLVPSRVHDQLAHIKSSYNNKYLTVKRIKFDFQQVNDVVLPHSLVMDTADEQDEDLSKESCTLFKIKDDTWEGCRKFRFQHCFFNTPAAFVVTPDETNTAGPWESFSYPYYVDLVDVTEQTILPPYLSFKDHNGSYLGVVDIEGRKYLEFASSAKKDDEFVIFTSLNYPDGQACIKSALKGGRYLLHTKEGDWIKAESEDCTVSEVLFKVSKVGGFFVIQCMTNKLFCTASKKDNRVFLQASAASITEDVELTMEEPILSREIYNIQPHRSDQARDFDTTDIKMATAIAYNETSEKNTVKSSMSITTTATSKHDSTSTHKVFGEASVSAGFTFLNLVDVGVQASGGYEKTDGKTWGTQDTTEKKQEIQYEVTVPASRKVTLTVTAKQVKRDIPFSYTQKDRLISGKYKIYDYDDGLYTGVDCFDLSYTTKEEKIEPKKEEKDQLPRKRRLTE